MSLAVFAGLSCGLMVGVLVYLAERSIRRRRESRNPRGRYDPNSPIRLATKAEVEAGTLPPVFAAKKPKPRVPWDIAKAHPDEVARLVGSGISIKIVKTKFGYVCSFWCCDARFGAMSFIAKTRDEAFRNAYYLKYGVVSRWEMGGCELKILRARLGYSQTRAEQVGDGVVQ